MFSFSFSHNYQGFTGTGSLIKVKMYANLINKVCSILTNSGEEALQAGELRKIRCELSCK